MINDLNESNPTEWQTRKNVIYETLETKTKKTKKAKQKRHNFAFPKFPRVT